MASTGTEKGNRGQRKAVGVLVKWARKRFKSSSQFGGGGYNLDPHKGDILCDTEGHYFPFCVEVKNYRDINFCQLLVPGLKGIKILEFWDQCLGDAKRNKKVPMLMMRFDNLPADFFFVVLTQEYAKLLHTEGLLPEGFRSLRYHNYKNGRALMIFDSYQFFKSNYKEVKAYTKKYLKILYK